MEEVVAVSDVSTVLNNSFAVLKNDTVDKSEVDLSQRKLQRIIKWRINEEGFFGASLDG